MVQDGLKEPVGVLATSQRAIVNVYTTIALLYCAASTWLYYQVADIPFLGLVHLVSFAVIAVNFVVLQKTRDYAIATHVILAVGTLVVSSQFALGGWGHTGYLWTFAYLPYAFFLATPPQARLWVINLLLVDAALVVAGLAGAFDLAYQGVELIIFVASLGIFLLCMFLFQTAVLRSERLADQRARELAAANHRLITSEANLAQAQELAQVGSWSWDPKAAQMTSSPQLRRIAGLDEELPGELSGLLAMVHADDREAVQGHVAATLQDGRPLEFEARILRRDGSVRLGHWRARAERDAQGNVLRLVGTTQDVTELRAAEEARRRAARQVQDIESLREVNRVRTQFMNTAAHELSTPLTPIQVELKLLRSPEIDRDPQRRERTLSILTRNIERLGLIVKDLLDGAKVQSSQLALQRSVLDLTALARDTVRAHAGVATEGGVALQLLGEAPMWVDGDARRLAQVLDNLVANAVKFTPRGGTVKVGLQRASGGVAVRVVDSGIGIRPDDVSRLFQPFSQLHDTMQKTRAGSGLGLYIAKGIVEAHGGNIGVESEGAGRGSVFWFVLPATDAPAATAA